MKKRVSSNPLEVRKQLKKYMIFLSIAFLSTVKVAHTQEVESSKKYIDFFVGNLDQAIELATFMKKPIFVYIDDEKKSALKKHYEDKVFINEKIVPLYSKNIMNLKLLATSVDARLLGKKHDEATPISLFYFDEEGNFYKKLTGKQEAETLLEVANDLLNEESETNNIDESEKLLHSFFGDFLNMKSRHKKGDRDASFLKEYAYALKKFNEPYNDVVYQYVKTANQHLFSPQYGNFLLDFAEDAKGIAFEYLVKDQERWKGILGKERLEKKLRKALETTVITASLQENPIDYEHALGQLQRLDISNSSHIFAKVLKGLYEQYNPTNLVKNSVAND